MISPTVLNTPKDIFYIYHDTIPPTVLNIPLGTQDIPHGAAHPHGTAHMLYRVHVVGRIVSMCLRPCPKEHITAPQVSIAKISCELSNTKNMRYHVKNCLLKIIAPIILTESLAHG